MHQRQVSHQYAWGSASQSSIPWHTWKASQHEELWDQQGTTQDLRIFVYEIQAFDTQMKMLILGFLVTDSSISKVVTLGISNLSMARDCRVKLLTLASGPSARKHWTPKHLRSSAKIEETEMDTWVNHTIQAHCCLVWYICALKFATEFVKTMRQNNAKQFAIQPAKLLVFLWEKIIAMHKKDRYQN